jgi:hypothetical protein
MKSDILNFFQRKSSPNTSERSRWTPVFLGIILAVFFFSCSPSEKRPTGILSKDEMTKVLTDFYLKEAKITSLLVGTDSGTAIFKHFRKKYALQSGVPDSAIDISYQYYLARPVELNEIYNRVIDSLSLKHHKVGNGEVLVQ